MEPNALDTMGESLLSYSLLYQMFEESADAIIVSDGDHIITANREASLMFGYHLSELQGQSIDMLLPEARRAAHQRHRDAYLEHPRHRPMGVGLQLSGLHKKGHEFTIEIDLNAFVEIAGVRIVVRIRRLGTRLS